MNELLLLERTVRVLSEVLRILPTRHPLYADITLVLGDIRANAPAIIDIEEEPKGLLTNGDA